MMCHASQYNYTNKALSIKSKETICNWCKNKQIEQRNNVKFRNVITPVI